MKRSLKWITWGFIVLTMLAAAFMLGGTLRRTSHITLPAPDDPAQAAEEDPAVSGDVLTVVAVTPETVQAAVETLARPETYSRTVTIEQFWEGGSGTYELTVSVSGGWTRVDRAMPDGRVRHTVTGEDAAYIWYNNEEKVYTAPAGGITADNEQSIPTYEDILALDAETITAADYRSTLGLRCIYVETAADEAGYALRYWVSVDTGLLVAAEKLLNRETVYRMGAPTVDQTEPAAFTLPDGTVLET
ncbi:hypothetical protein [uncultured Dysosmobacter sp.]|uniref:hypothetical protein n=1 Tax=uncultured Dysosmobacter sp. TaxID=2591384 RepID=UPI002618E151|nr:hypothetical protein [uncultured Dysosmobacter sp.]